MRTWIDDINESRRRITGDDPTEIPPRVFISYRISTESNDAWVRQLAENLVDRGYVVFFDQMFDKKLLNSLEQKFVRRPVAAIVATLATCHYYVAVIDSGYLARTGCAQDRSIEDGWLFDEHDLAFELALDNRISIIGLLREGNELPRGFNNLIAASPQDVLAREVDQKIGDKPKVSRDVPRRGAATILSVDHSQQFCFYPDRNVGALDVCTDDALKRVLDENFPVVVNNVSRDRWRRGNSMIISAELASACGVHDVAYHYAEEAAKSVPGLSAGHAVKARMARKADRARDGLVAVRRALSIEPGLVQLHGTGAACAYHAKDITAAVRFAVLAIEHDSSDGSSHWVLGNALDDMGQVYAGIAHLEVARSISGRKGCSNCAMLHNDTGFVYRRVGNPKRALECFAEGIKLDPNLELLFENRAAASIEARDQELARRFVSELSQQYPHNRSLKSLTTDLREWNEGGQHPVQVDVGNYDYGTLKCSHCVATLPFPSQETSVCESCGALMDPCNECGYCDSPKIVLLNSETRCPYCHAGNFTYSGSN